MGMEGTPQINTEMEGELDTIGEHEVVEYDESDESDESADLKIEKALPQEKSILERFTGKARKVAGLMTLVSALSVVPGVAQEAYGQEKKTGTKIEQVEKAHVTESGSWAQDMVKSTRADVPKLKTEKDAEWFVRSNFGDFLKELGPFKTKGNLKDSSYSNLAKERISTDDDLDVILASIKDMDKILDEVNTKFHLADYTNKKEDLAKFTKIYEDQTSYAGKKEKEAWDRISKEYNLK